MFQTSSNVLGNLQVLFPDFNKHKFYSIKNIASKSNRRKDYANATQIMLCSDMSSGWIHFCEALLLHKLEALLGMPLVE